MARLSDDKKYIIDKNGKRVEFSDPRVWHVFPIDINVYIKRMLKSFVEKKGLQFRFSDETNAEILHYSRRLCSGRECLPCASVAGATFKDVEENRKEGEITVYYNVDQDSPCQNGAWRTVWEMFRERLNNEDIVCFVGPQVIAGEFVVAVVLGDIIYEVESALKCIAKDKRAALNEFEVATKNFIENIEVKTSVIEKSLKRWALEISKIPTNGSLDKTPKVLLFGGFNTSFVHHHFKRYLEDKGVIVKLDDTLYGLLWAETHNILKATTERGCVSPKQHLDFLHVISCLFNKDRKRGRTALKKRIRLSVFESYVKRLRKIAKQSNLLYDVHTPFRKTIEEGHKHVSFVSYNEASATLGKFVVAAESKVFDALIALEVFNCQPAQISMGIMRTLANKRDILFAAIECESSEITVDQKKILDAIISQMREVK